MKITRINEDRFNVNTRFGEVQVNDASAYRSYYFSIKVPDDLKLALSLIGVDISKLTESPSGKTDVDGHDVHYAMNGTRIVIHTSKGKRKRVEVALDEIFGIPESSWRKPL